MRLLSLLSLLLLFCSCEQKSPKFKVENCYKTKPGNQISNDLIIEDLIFRNYEKSEEVFVIEIFSPTFKSAVLFSVQKRERSLRINFLNNRVDILNNKEIAILKQINTKNFIKLIGSHNHTKKDISEFSSYTFLKYKNHELTSSNSIIDYRMDNSLALKNNIKAIYDLLNTYSDKRKSCYSR